MSGRANALRMQVETALAGRVASPFEYRERRVETVPAGVAEIDRLTGGLPRGALTEICGPGASGRTSVLMAAMAARMEASEVCALVDARDAFDPESAAEAGVRLGQLLWVRCRNVDQALRAADLLIQGGGFGLIALDLGDTPARVARAIPLPVWFRMRRAVENTPTILVALERESNAKTCASLVLRMEAREARWAETNETIDEDEEKIPTLTHRAWGTRKIFCGETCCEQFGVVGSETEQGGDVPTKAPRSKTEHGVPEKAQPAGIKVASIATGKDEIPTPATPGKLTNRAWGTRKFVDEIVENPHPLQKPQRMPFVPQGKRHPQKQSTCKNEDSTRDARIFLPYAQGCLFEGARNYAEVMRSKAKREGDRLIWREEMTEGTEFGTRAR